MDTARDSVLPKRSPSKPFVRPILSKRGAVPMIPPFVTQICSHLEKQDYAVTHHTEDGIYAFEHEGFWNFMLAPMGGGAMLRATFTTSAAANGPALFALANELNREAAVSRFYLDDEGSFNMEAWWPPVYESEAFESFVAAWHHDSALLAQNGSAGTLLG